MKTMSSAVKPMAMPSLGLTLPDCTTEISKMEQQHNIRVIPAYIQNNLTSNQAEKRAEKL